MRSLQGPKPPKSAINRWIICFKKGGENVENEVCNGKIPTATWQEYIILIHVEIEEYLKLVVETIDNTMDFSNDSAYIILMEKF